MRHLLTSIGLCFSCGLTLGLMASVSEAQTGGGPIPRTTGQTPWSIPDREHPDPGRPRGGFSFKVKRSHSIRCEIHQVEALGRLYVEEAGGDQYWIQLPSAVKISTSDPAGFGGRKKLEIEDLQVGHRLHVTVRGQDDIKKVKVLRSRPVEP